MAKTTASNPVTLGTFEGECADANITNLNGLDITREVWETVFSSEDYQQGIELGWYLGYLGHPEDPNCMDFQNACIKMTEGHIEDDGKVYGKFDLLDTPVGRIVKTFIDAGVQFGISVRGAGDIIDNSVDPESFVFRGFDLVSFPAFPESIPEFTEIAASTDAESRKRYKAICAAVKTNIDEINSTDTISILQSHFAKQSDEYKMLEAKKDALNNSIDIHDEQMSSLVDLYSSVNIENAQLKSEVSSLRSQLSVVTSAYRRKFDAIKRIMNSRFSELSEEFDEIESDYISASTKLENWQAKYNKLNSAYTTLQDKNADLAEGNAILASKNKKLKQTTEKLRLENSELSKKNTQIIEANNKLKSENLKYIHTIESSNAELDQQASIIASMQTDIDKTVVDIQSEKDKASNLDEKVTKLNNQIEAQARIIADYQDAYGNMYANALGIHLDNVAISSNTTVDELQSLIRSESSKSIMASRLDSTPDVDEFYDDISTDDADTMVTL